MSCKLDFDLLKKRKLIFDGVEYPVREKLVRDEMGPVRDFRQRYRDIINECLSVGEAEWLVFKEKEIEAMTEAIMYFCDIPKEKIAAISVKAFYALHSYVMGNSLDGEALDADAHRLAGPFRCNGVEREIKAPMIGDMVRIFEIRDTRLADTTASEDEIAQNEAMIDIASLCVEMDRNEFYNIPFAGLMQIVMTIFDSVNRKNSENEESEKNA